MMRKKLLSTVALVFGGVLICLAVMADLTGKWKGAFKTANGEFPIAYTFKVDGEKLNGTVTTPQGEMPISDGKISGVNFVFNVDYNGNPLKNVGKFYGDSITIDIAFGANPLHGVLKRVVEEKK